MDVLSCLFILSSYNVHKKPTYHVEFKSDMEYLSFKIDIVNTRYVRTRSVFGQFSYVRKSIELNHSQWILKR